MILTDILQGISATIVGNTSIEIADLQFDSRRVHKGSLFVAQVGVHADGHRYISTAIEHDTTVYAKWEEEEKKENDA